MVTDWKVENAVREIKDLRVGSIHLLCLSKA